MSSSILTTSPTSSNTIFRANPKHTTKPLPPPPPSIISLTCRSRNHSRPIRTKKTLQVRKVAGIDDFSVAADPASSGLTWQIVIGSLAGVTPFVVAGIEFSKRIMAQKKCEVCGGSGLVLKKEVYVRCRGCGGFLPWQSWKRFFTG